MDHDHDLLTAQEVATALRVSKMTIYRLIKNGTLDAIKVGRAFRIKRASYEAYRNQSEAGAGE